MKFVWPIRLVHIKDRLLSTLWFVPAIMSLASLVLAGAMPAIDRQVVMGKHLPWNLVTASSVEGARAVLSTIAGSMITVAGVVFSVTIVALTLASSQFGPRLLRNFMRDTANQVVLGAFIATFLYCLVVLKMVREVPGEDFVPNVSLLVALVLAGGCMALLIYFIHHIATSIQAEQVVARVMSEFRETVDRLYPEADRGEAATDESGTRSSLPESFEETAEPVRAVKDGYIQRLDFDELLSWLASEDLYLDVAVQPGEFHVKNAILARVGPADRLSDEARKRVASAMIQGPVRTPVQDVTFSFGQIVEVAIRSLSPGINDPMTAMHCVDQLTAALAECSRRRFPSDVRMDHEGCGRIRTRPLAFRNLARLAYRQIHHHGRTHPEVVSSLLQSMEHLLPHLRHRRQTEAVREEFERVREGVDAHISSNEARKDLHEQCDRIGGLLGS